MSKILLIDIETSPSLGWVWSKWETNVIDFEQDWYILSFGYKWLGEKKVTVFGLDDFNGYKKDPENDKNLINMLWTLLDEADVIIAHNGDRFDIPKINTRFLTHKLNPPSPYKTIDTLKIARSVFKFDSNKLDDLGRYLSIGRKLPHTGFHLWKGCMSGDKASWKLMKKYNSNDVELLEKVYYIMRSWAKNHPAINQGLSECCPKCQSQKVQRRGFDYTLQRKKQRYVCTDCHGWFQGPATK
jgi:uncharacterized protein YprB with RNaseH-like and TPR domain